MINLLLCLFWVINLPYIYCDILFIFLFFLGGVHATDQRSGDLTRWSWLPDTSPQWVFTMWPQEDPPCELMGKRRYTKWFYSNIFWYHCEYLRLCTIQYLYPTTQYFWLWVLHMGQRQKLQLITQDLICSKWGEHVTEPVVNKSSQLLLLIITVITLIISNSAPWYERVSVYSRFWMPRSPATWNYELCSGVSELLAKKKVNFAKREWTVLFYESLAHVFGCLPFLWHCAPPYEPCYGRQMAN